MYQFWPLKLLDHYVSGCTSHVSTKLEVRGPTGIRTQDTLLKRQVL
ncbi:MAG: hypothetical protein UX32_C0007G0021 [Microgenomates group bacterium GW2011_GWF1_46_12]|nr:MAG: hypothetical protein UX32_C0007G0021 [Microgenomates group bacterium GW2011_GWF1_46_12]